MPQFCPSMPFPLTLKQFVDPKGVDYNTRLQFGGWQSWFIFERSGVHVLARRLPVL